MSRQRRLGRRVGAWLEAALARRPVRRTSARRGHRATDGAASPERLPVTFFIWNVHAMGGTVRTVLRQASALADLGHPVTIVSVVRHHYQDAPFFGFDPRVDVEVLVDRYRLTRRRGPLAAALRRLDARPAPGSQISLGREAQGSLLTELRVITRVVRSRGIVIGTRVGLNLAIARFAHPTNLRVAQEHLGLARYAEPVQRAISRHLQHIDVVACLTQAEAAVYRRALGDQGPLVTVVPNAVPDRLPAPADPGTRRIVAIGRLERAKGFDLLVEAFAKVAPRHPDWTLRIVGDGRRREELVSEIGRLGLEDRVELVPGTPDVDEELRQASVYALSSRFESFGMVLLEAMAAGLAVVAFACRQGPREFLTAGRNALLAPPKDVDAFADHLDRVMSDPALRARMGRDARSDVEAFTISEVTARWSEVLDEAATRAASGGRVGSSAPVRGRDREADDAAPLASHGDRERVRAPARWVSAGR